MFREDFCDEMNRIGRGRAIRAMSKKAWFVCAWVGSGDGGGYMHDSVQDRVFVKCCMLYSGLTNV